MSGTHKQRASTRSAMPWLSLCAALALVGILLLLQARSRADSTLRPRTQGSYAPALRQALFGRDRADPGDAGAGGASTGLVSGASTALSAERATGSGFDSAADPVSASEAALSVPSESPSGDEPQAVRATTPASLPAH